MYAMVVFKLEDDAPNAFGAWLDLSCARLVNIQKKRASYATAFLSGESEAKQTHPQEVNALLHAKFDALLQVVEAR